VVEFNGEKENVKNKIDEEMREKDVVKQSLSISG
jgi:hypothetical protein